MPEILRRSVLMLAFAALVSPLAACAAAGPVVPLSPDKLDGAKYKLLVLSGRMDQRVVQFKRKGENGVIGTLVDKGRVLSLQVGIADDMEVFSLSHVEGQPANTFEGLFRNVAGDGRSAESLVTVQFFEDTLTWNLESASWERVE